MPLLRLLAPIPYNGQCPLAASGHFPPQFAFCGHALGMNAAFVSNLYGFVS